MAQLINVFLFTVNVFFAKMNDAVFMCSLVHFAVAGVAPALPSTACSQKATT